jgi:succinylglutamate desuccinylase
MAERFDVHQGLPAGLESVPASELINRLDRPALIYIQGARDPALFISVLLHGNEVSGWDALRALLGGRTSPLPRSIIVFVGNVGAAAEGVRHLPDEPDFNRIWNGGKSPEERMAAEVLETIARHDLFGAVDLHNNTGHNPHYAVITDTRPETLGLALTFNHLAVYTRAPETVQTLAFAQLAPALTVETGHAEDPEAAARALVYLETLLALDTLPTATTDDLELYRSGVRVVVPNGGHFHFDEGPGLALRRDLEIFNFRPLPAGTRFATLNGDDARSLRVVDERHRDVTDEYFGYESGDIRLKDAVIPAMYTTDPEIVAQDCLCYFMHHYDPAFDESG